MLATTVVSTELTQEQSDRLCTLLAQALERDLGSASFANPEHWSLKSVKTEFLMKKHLPVVRLVRENASVCFIIAPSDRAQPAYKRTNRLDLTYFSEDVPDNDQHVIYERDRVTIDRMVGWLVRFDATTPQLL